MLKVGLGDLVLGELGDLGVVHLDAVDAGELLDDPPRTPIERMGERGCHHETLGSYSEGFKTWEMCLKAGMLLPEPHKMVQF